ncbi:universal stress protein [Aquabacter spiritensis]|uniref:Nucleotide-binding universal stress UspA family protein n=1 Tax=Aquabacter spiritensis TaxID=933073 RepID=A0A4V2UYC3_9HYPH|nr:universal stress protein [Aquabacter spiritensis]TCT06818.1 nucleotide-binding universal stress UspA family protein [Aquabacter spiritensis]
MSYLIGYAPDRGGMDALAVGRMMALAGDVPVTVCVVTPETWGYPSPAAVDAEYKQFLDQYAQKALARARAYIGDKVKADYMVVAADSASKGLSRVANEMNAYLTIVGSARDGKKMRAGLGSTASGVLAGTKCPTVMAPLGYASHAPRRLERVTCAFSDDREGASTVAVAVDLARQHKVPLRLVTFVVRDRQMYPSDVGYHAENMVANTWRKQATDAQKAALAELPEGIEASCAIGDGPDWRRAIDSVGWAWGDVLVAGAHHESGITAFLFGSTFTRLLRYVSVPIVAVD